MSEQRFCAAKACGKPLFRRKDECSSSFKRRQTCGLLCGAKMPRAHPRYIHAGAVGVCRFCGGPTKVKSNGEPMVSCAEPECRKKAYQGAHLANYVPWPRPTGEIAASFHAQNIIPGDAYGSLPLRPATAVLKSSSIA